MTGPVRRARSARRMVTPSLRAHGLERDARPCHRGESRSHERVLARGLTPGPEPSLACTAKRRLRPRRVAGTDRSSGRRALPRGARRRPSRGRRWREHHAATPRMSTCRHRRATLLETRSTTTCTRSVRVGASAAAGSRWLLHVPAAGQRPLVVVGDDLVHQALGRSPVRDRVDAAPSHELADLSLDRVDPAHPVVSSGKTVTAPGRPAAARTS